MAPEAIPQFLSRLTISCDAASKLADMAHRDAFLGLFEETLTILRPIIGDVTKVLLSSKQPNLFRKDSQSAWVEVADIWENTVQVASDIYLEKAAEHELCFKGKQTWTLKVGSDPILFELTVDDLP